MAWELALSTLTGTIAALIGIEPRVVPFLLFALATLLLIRKPEHALTRLRDAAVSPLSLIVLALPAYALLSALWAVHFQQAAETAAVTFIMALSGLIIATCLIAWFETMAPASRIRFVRAIPIGAAFIVAYIGIELLFNSPILRGIVQAFPDVVSERAKGFVVRDGEFVNVRPFHYNRGVAGLVLLIAPILAALFAWRSDRNRAFIAIAFTIAVTAIAFLSHSETAKVALLVGIVIFACAQIHITTTTRTLAIVFAVAVVFAIPISKLPHQLSLHENAWLPFSFRDRVVIWDQTANAALKNPILGIGAQSTRFLQHEKAGPSDHSTPALTIDKPRARKASAFRPVERRLGWHTHNIYLQIWFELGLIGATLFLCLGVTLINAIKHLETSIQPWAVAFASVVMVASATGWSVWQTWFQGTLAFALCAIALADAHCKRRAFEAG